MEDGQPVSTVPDVARTKDLRRSIRPIGPSEPPAVFVARRSLLGGAQVRWSNRDDGDLAGWGPEVQRRRQQVVALPWTVFRQVHGRRVMVVRWPGEGSGVEADGSVTVVRGAALAVLSADCAPVALASAEGVIGVAHAGWRGLASGVLDATVDAMRMVGATRIQAVIGPCIRTACYPFGAEDLDDVVAHTGPELRGVDRHGRPAADVAAGVAAALHRAGVDDVDDVGICTACSEDHWSWRARSEQNRQATVVWRP
ncbi:MAG: polyphenol oxidase family protein [Actinomycetota bacterium]|nr:polyphenol oxidase family protein [Actinomycetota bacterium]